VVVAADAETPAGESVAAAIAGDFDARFADLINAAYRVAYRVLGDATRAEELAQEATARCCARWKRVEPYAEAWVSKVAGNLAIDEVRRQQRVRSTPIPPTPASATASAASETDLRVDLQRVLRRLPRRQRAVIVLRYLADQSETQTAAALGCAVGTVRQHTARGLAALRVQLPSLEEIQ
jgi:RNA polymerase sigma-70 factor (sigma-E family)